MSDSRALGSKHIICIYNPIFTIFLLTVTILTFIVTIITIIVTIISVVVTTIAIIIIIIITPAHACHLFNKDVATRADARGANRGNRVEDLHSFEAEFRTLSRERHVYIMRHV